MGNKETLLIKSQRYSAYKVNIKYLGTDSLMWILENGTIVKETFEPDFVSLLSNKAEALNNKTKVIDISEKTSIKSKFSIKNPRKTQYLKLRIWGEKLDLDKFDIYDGYSQLKENVYLVIKKPDLRSIDSDNLPFSNKNIDEFLEPSNLIQSDNDKLINLGKKIIGEETDSLRASEKINEWVFNYLEKIPIVSIPSALEVLENKKGDCNEHAVLFAAITRAVGIPSKIALGLVYLNGRFYYHAWNEVYIGKWVSVDPTFGQIPADATHLKVLEGDISRSSEILEVVGKINIDIIDAY